MSVLLTGFGPFAEHGSNPSEALVTAPALLAMPDVNSLVLPTCFNRAPDLLIQRIEETLPQAILMFGLAATSTNLRLERFARNRNTSASADNDGVMGTSLGASVPMGPATYVSSLPLLAMSRIASQKGASVAFSDDAGGFVCNHTFYRIAHYLAERYPRTRCGFVHIPTPMPREPQLEAWVDVIIAWIKLLQP
ncbi:MAG: hypothetical protein RJA70_4324 [Pseudomonadota bacterium]|jgi:pyroglutamyl-peptidase